MLLVPVVLLPEPPTPRFLSPPAYPAPQHRRRPYLALLTSPNLPAPIPSRRTHRKIKEGSSDALCLPLYRLPPSLASSQVSVSQCLVSLRLPDLPTATEIQATEHTVILYPKYIYIYIEREIPLYISIYLFYFQRGRYRDDLAGPGTLLFFFRLAR